VVLHEPEPLSARVNVKLHRGVGPAITLTVPPTGAPENWGVTDTPKLTELSSPKATELGDGVTATVVGPGRP
jgi:hypothetical protein